MLSYSAPIVKGEPPKQRESGLNSEDHEWMQPPSHAAGTRRLGDKAEHAERLVRLAEFLPPLQRQMVRCIYADGLETSAVAALLGISQSLLAARLRRLVQRMLSPEFALVALRREQWEPGFSRLACACVLSGQSMRAVARAQKVSIHAVRQARQRVLAMAEALRIESRPLTPTPSRWRTAQSTHEQ